MLLTKEAVKVSTFSVAVPVKLNVAISTRVKDKFAAVPDMVPDAEPEPGSVLISAHVESLRVWMPVALVDPENEVPNCVSTIVNEPPSLNEHPLDPVPDHDHVPAHVPVSDTGLTVTVVVPQDEAPAISTAQTPKVYVPATFGVPVKFPFKSIIIPIGGAPVAKESD